MSTFDLDWLRAIMRRCGLEDGVDLDTDILDVPFADLGCDSLATMEIAAVVSRETRLAIPEEFAEAGQTPRSLLDYVNSRVAVV